MSAEALTFLGAVLLVVLVGREIVCWYWKTSAIHKELVQANQTLTAICAALEPGAPKPEPLPAFKPKVSRFTEPAAAYNPAPTPPEKAD